MAAKALRFSAALVCLCVVTADIAQSETVYLWNKNGTFVVPVLINDRIPLDFTIDSGASDVSIPIDVYLTLVRTGTISDKDVLGSAVYRLANGSEERATLFRIRSLRVGSVELRNVAGSTTSVKGSLLLGQSFLSRLKSWSIDNDRHVLIMNEDRSTQSAQAPMGKAAATQADAAKSAPPVNGTFWLPVGEINNNAVSYDPGSVSIKSAGEVLVWTRWTHVGAGAPFEMQLQLDCQQRILRIVTAFPLPAGPKPEMPWTPTSPGTATYNLMDRLCTSSR